MRLTETAPAKVNLALHVTGRREDGFHTLHSLCVFTELADLVSAESARNDALSISGPFGGDLPNGRSNLVVRTVEKFRARFPDALQSGIALHLEKHVPVAAGLGGGSADAAAVIRLLAQMTDEDIPDADLFALAATLGADVPMCLFSRPCEVLGIGETLKPVSAFPALHLVLVNPREAVATPDVFRRLKSRSNPPMPQLPRSIDRAAMLSLWLADTRNDLEPPAREIVPAIAEITEAIAATQNCVLARMSGSGATCFGLYGSAAAAHQAAHDLREKLQGYWVAATPILVE
ncbi:4-(cytidine 5'-diphospho)-2-C-methyl-D-erythritol kinase [Pelagibacterium xiamenense]|uniref:4-(cytidine 5'-diphospho)-2-C-methyl-D-erythritol kinase n=1 Tax=Pelagibacterium xiamenense TaxID=2901140 RepID=UPI001E548F1E|nr:4-(cytidine 5'-diphospho)-2-C-methyl-D-erythritol kinase [Pelagibacterium xiamenense]MCD7059278.1 4-(cytidine 5'-diphospho)-2-C-methyl-D-erythritol kinase [Pelagibacterium xiamenense]